MRPLAPQRIAKSAIEKYRARRTSFPTFVMELEQAVSAVEGEGVGEGRELRRIWGQLEIINAVSLDAGLHVSASDVEVGGLVDAFLSALPGDSDDERDEGCV